MKALIVYYSRTSTTQKLAEDIQKELNCDIEEIKPLKEFNGVSGFVKGGFQSTTKKSPEIEAIKNNPEDYDIIVIGTPVWASTMASPIYTYIKENKDKFKSIALFTTCGSRGYESTLNNMAKLAEKEAKVTFFATKETLKSNYENKIKEFTENIKQ